MSKEKFKSLVITILVIAIVSMSVVYATLTQRLQINTTAILEKNQSLWNIYFDSTSIQKLTPVGYAEVASGKELTTNGLTTLENLEVTLKAPGDAISYTFTVKNDGSLPGKISEVTLPNLNNATYSSTNNITADINLVKANIEYSLTYNNDATYGNKTPEVNDTLPANSSKSLKLTISYKSSATDLPSEAVTVSGLNARIDYVQNN